MDKFSTGKLEVGDIFSEMYAFWVNVINIDKEGKIITLEHNDINSAEIVCYNSFVEFDKRFSYGTIPGHWVGYIENDIDKVRNRFLEYKKSLIVNSKEQVREIKINNILYNIDNILI